MTYLSSLFSSYAINSGRDKVMVVDGTLSPISGKGSINVLPTLFLSSVLHVPKFATNFDPLVILLVILIVLLFSSLHIVFFRTWLRKGQLGVVVQLMAFISLTQTQILHRLLHFSLVVVVKIIKNG